MKRPSRRQVLRGLLRGAAVGVALPTFEYLLNSRGTAYADETALPDRFGLWFWGNGIRPEHWVPSTTGAGFSPSVELAPLGGLLDYVSVATGFEVKTATHPHHSGMAAILTGQKYYQLGTTRDTIVSTMARQTVDQDAADWFSGLAPFRSLELGVTRFHGTDEGTTFQHLSHNGPNNPNPAEYDPVTVYRRLFAAPSDPVRNLARQSVLDAVNGQIGRLSGQLGAADRARLEQHTESIRALELRLASTYAACEPFDEPVAAADIDGLEQIEEKGALMADLLAYALACDLTRVFSVEWSTAGSGVYVWQVGATDGLHSTCHNESMPQDVVHAATTFTMEQLAHFLGRLRDTPEGDGNLLDRSAILCTSELSDGHIHSNQEYPFLLCGKGSGRLRGGVHHRSSSLESVSRLSLTALHGAGVELASWGADEGYETAPIAELLT